MSELNSPGVSAPGLPPGVTVIESAQQAPAITAPVSDTTGLSPSQAAAMQRIDARRIEIISGTSNSKVLADNQSDLAHVFHGGPDPRAASGADGARPADGALPDLGQQMVPVTLEGAQAAAQKAITVHQLDAGIASQASQFAFQAGLPAAVADAVFQRVAHHAALGAGPDVALSPEQRADLESALVESMGSVEKVTAEVELARRYLHHVGGDALLHQVDTRAGSAGLDPRIILQLSFLARSKGLDKTK